ncbi:hypothetical protein CV102_14215 [Natronococcus pandeyae]|uniref:Uncharacterized protein n=1 Tax=Natronococcus pandeyae TaxID=2055836 RepID=A0A8J8Q0H8_9EURY|nr:hypothetical protein [Natronococcus pandeyae]TYL37880.1 hypothetical protein CV102_14215 [Natronococcus pandeyae]
MSTTRSAASRSIAVVARVKTWPAYLLAVCFPGAGHWYTRQWMRGLSWAVLYAAALVFLSSGAIFLDGTVADPLVITILRLEGAAFADVAVPLAVLVCSVLDLYTRVALVDDGPASS